MKKIETNIEGLFIIEPDVFKDERGYFFESYNKKKYDDLGIDYDFMQDNESLSKYGTIRGLHFQKDMTNKGGQDCRQAKLVRCTKGVVLDVAVDIRPNSTTFGKWYSVELSEENKLQFMIPRGFAHGFSVLSEVAVFCYKCDNIYNKESEGGIMYNDPDLKIDWKIPQYKILVSDRDKGHPLLKEKLCF